MISTISSKSESAPEIVWNFFWALFNVAEFEFFPLSVAGLAAVSRSRVVALARSDRTFDYFRVAKRKH
jgi:hypothetical protein